MLHIHPWSHTQGFTSNNAGHSGTHVGSLRPAHTVHRSLDHSARTKNCQTFITVEWTRCTQHGWSSQTVWETVRQLDAHRAVIPLQEVQNQTEAVTLRPGSDGRGPPALLVGKQTGAAAMENSMKFSQRTKNGSVKWSSNSTTGNLSQENKITNLKRYVHRYVYHTSFTIPNIWKQPKCPLTD